MTLSFGVWLFVAFATSFLVFLCWIAFTGDFLDAVPPDARPRAVRKLRMLAWSGLLHPLLGLVAWDACRLYRERSGVSERTPAIVTTVHIAAATSVLSTVGAAAFAVAAL